MMFPHVLPNLQLFLQLYRPPKLPTETFHSSCPNLAKCLTSTVASKACCLSTPSQNLDVTSITSAITNFLCDTHCSTHIRLMMTCGFGRHDVAALENTSGLMGGCLWSNNSETHHVGYWAITPTLHTPTSLQ